MADHPLPEAEVATEWLASMLLIRRFEERAGEMYAKAKVGGFLHLAIGEEATIVGSVRALRDADYLISTYRSHGHALARGTSPDAVMAELFGKQDGLCHGRGGSMHMFDLERRFLGGYGIVGGNLPLAAGIAMASDQLGRDEVTLCQFGDGAANQGTFGETLNLAALWQLPVVFMVTNNQFGMGTALERHSAVTDLFLRGEGYGVPGMRCDGMDVVDTHAVTAEALRRARGGAARQRVPVRAVGGDQVVGLAQRPDGADDGRLLADRQVQEAADLGLGVHLARPLLEAADQRHGRQPLPGDGRLGERTLPALAFDGLRHVVSHRPSRPP